MIYWLGILIAVVLIAWSLWEDREQDPEWLQRLRERVK